MNFRIAFTALAAVGFIKGVEAVENKQNNKSHERPNIIIMLADDLGYGDIGCYGSVINTPNLDQLAQQGVRFTDFYAAAPNCSPSRTGMLTGRSPYRNGMYSYRPQGHPMHLRNDEITIAEQLKQVDYQTVHLGKWHLGCLPQDPTFNHPQPSNQGFDYSYGTESNSRPSHHNPINFVRNGEKLPMQQGYSCQLLADEAIKWWDNHYDKSNPFFMYIAFHEPHAKVAAPDSLVKKYKQHGREATYLACIENMDKAIGRIKAKLNEMGATNNTIIVFASDNGSYRRGSNGELRALKSWLYEGGIRVPGIISWPDQIKGKQEINEPAGLVDLFPTISRIAQLKVPKDREYDGTNILPLLEGKKFDRKKPLSWFFYRTSPEIAIRKGDLMIMGKDEDIEPRTHSFGRQDMEYIDTMSLKSVEVYNVVKNPGQKDGIVDMTKNERYLNMLQEKLQYIQKEGYKWNELPAPESTKKLKTDWKKY
ncbi:sulfatase [Puteibacter caeruleilacunae]|nr:sulfatase [Puteibacter caeruleilacunae]